MRNSVVRPNPTCAFARAYTAAGGPPPRWLFLALWGACLAAAALTARWRPGIVRGHSMEPALPAGSLFLYDREAYRARAPQRGDVIVAVVGAEVWVKRVYAAPGERIWILRSVTPDGTFLEPIRRGQESVLRRFAAGLNRKARSVRYDVVPMRLGPDRWFLVGDSATSEDSRAVGPVRIRRILGRVFWTSGGRVKPMPSWVEHHFPGTEELEEFGIRQLPPGRRRRSWPAS